MNAIDFFNTAMNDILEEAYNLHDLVRKNYNKDQLLFAIGTLQLTVQEYIQEYLIQAETLNLDPSYYVLLSGLQMPINAIKKWDVDDGCMVLMIDDILCQVISSYITLPEAVRNMLISDEGLEFFQTRTMKLAYARRY